MNERAREALVAAALSGVPQVKYMYWDGGDGRCALGVIGHALGCFETAYQIGEMPSVVITREAGLGRGEYSEIVNANDHLDWDFLTIARKIGNDDAVNPTQEATK